ncbi:MAG: LacI family transcriptional regulator [Microbacteriaceae bacterium]|jgi:LacI family transcriptional regulator|nr:LacI family transcriptional regulator [Microbacteriaceae bacterium]
MTVRNDAEPTQQRRMSAVPTIHDVAAHAGVSPMTVSRVLAGGTSVRPAKMERVLAAVAELGYRKNENARSLRPGQRTGLIGVIITNVSNPYYAELQLGVEEVLSAENIRLLVGNSGEDPARERQLVADFIGRHVDGLIVVPTGGDTSHLSERSLGSIPLVLASRELEGIEADTVVIDDVKGAFEGTSQLISEGHTRIAYLGNMVSVFTSKRRYDGFEKAHKDAGIEVVPELVRAGQRDPATAQDAMEELLQLPDPPTAVFSANNRNTIGVLRALRSNALSFAQPGETAPRSDIRVVGFDNFELSDMMPFLLNVIEHDARELGRQAGKLLVRRLRENNNDAPRKVQLPTHLRI